MSLPNIPRKNNHKRLKRRSGRGRGNAGSAWSRRSQQMNAGVWRQLPRQNGAVTIVLPLSFYHRTQLTNC